MFRRENLMRKRNVFMLLLSKLYIYSHKGFFLNLLFHLILMLQWINDPMIKKTFLIMTMKIKRYTRNLTIREVSRIINYLPVQRLLILIRNYTYKQTWVVLDIDLSVTWLQLLIKNSYIGIHALRKVLEFEYIL